MPASLIVAACVSAALGALCVIAAGARVRRRRWLGATVSALAGGLLLALGALAGTVSVAIRGYQALTYEAVAAKVRTEPLAPQRFRATVTLADGSLHMYDLAGDAVYVDAHILKWHPWVNLIGLHTVYELDRIAGRYNTVAEERSRPRTVYSLARGKPLDMFTLARHYKFLAPLVDAQYGSATFVGTRQAAQFEVRVSTTGLLMRAVQF
ncbi:MAG TPA: hypothetical protein VGQ25_08740 [Gemmatimonadales bacterium]|jgi:hypothetical protein|nr:hypothetical protein [Gemmatimonadales bacterium]